MARSESGYIAAKGRTPFVMQTNGKWRLMLCKDDSLIWGYRFDAGVGYRIYFMFEGNWKTNIFVPEQAREIGLTACRNARGNKDTITIAKVLRRLADQVEKLKDKWDADCMTDLENTIMEGATHSCEGLVRTTLT